MRYQCAGNFCTSHLLRMFILLTICMLPVLLLAQSQRDLQFQKLSSIHFPGTDIVSTRKPVIDYPYVYIPDSYGFLVCQWDSLAGSFTQITSYGVPGKVMEMVQWQSYLFLCVDFSTYTPLIAERSVVVKVDISDPIHPLTVDSIASGPGLHTFGNLRALGNKLVARRAINNVLQDLAVLDPVECAVIGSYPGLYHFEVLWGQYLVTRPMNSQSFLLYTLEITGDLTLMGTLGLPYEVNTFPGFFCVGQGTVGTYCGSGFMLWNTGNMLDWQMLSNTLQSTSGQPGMCNGRLVYANYEVAVDRTRFYVYDLSDPGSPVQVANCDYPSGLGSWPEVLCMASYGSYILHNCLSYGAVCLQIQPDGMIGLVRKCYAFNAISVRGSRFGNYLLQPFLRSGIAAFDISDPLAPQYSWSLFADYTVSADVCGDYLGGTFRPNSGGTVMDRVYRISDPSAPELVYSAPQSMGGCLFFDKAQPGSFYVLNGNAMRVVKFTISANTAYEMCSVTLPVAVQTPAFVDGVLYLAAVQGNGAWHDLYCVSGFPMDDPQVPLAQISFLESPGLVYPAGNHLFIRNVSSTAQYCRFYHPASVIQVDRDLWGFDFRNYVCIGTETSIRFYNVSGLPNGYQTPDYDLPQYSYTLNMEWDADFAYLFAADNISIWSYQTTEVVDEHVPQAGTTRCFPNPFSGELWITDSSVHRADAIVEVFNIKGRLVRVLKAECTREGIQAVWNGMDGYGKAVPAGIYLVRASAPHVKASISRVTKLQ